MIAQIEFIEASYCSQIQLIECIVLFGTFV